MFVIAYRKREAILLQCDCDCDYDYARDAGTAVEIDPELIMPEKIATTSSPNCLDSWNEFPMNYCMVY